MFLARDNLMQSTMYASLNNVKTCGLKSFRQKLPEIGICLDDGHGTRRLKRIFT